MFRPALIVLSSRRMQRPDPASEPSTRRSVGLALFAALVLATLPVAASARTMADGFSDLAQKLLPAVVNISTTQTVEGNAGVEMPQLPPGSPFEEFFKEFLERNQPKQQRRRATSLGSGFIIDAKGLIVTNNHVIQDADEITVVLHDDTRLPAKVVGRDAKTDIAVLRVEPTGSLTAVKFGNSDSMRVGDWILAIGNPFGFGGTVTQGIISARGRDINAGPYDDFLQTDAPINRGNSGGPMFNLDGEVIGINTAIFSPSGGSVGIGFAIPSNSAKPVIDQLVQHGEVKRGWLGVRIQAVNEEIAEAMGLKSVTGALVASVIDGGPADKAGIKDGDVILEFDGKEVGQMRRLPRLVADTEVGKTVPLKVWRKGQELAFKVTVGAMEEAEEKVSATAPAEKPAEGQKIEALGVTVAGIDKRNRERFGLDDDAKGVVVTEVNPEGPAADQGLRVGELIVEIGQETVGSPGDLASKVKEAQGRERKSVLLLVEGQGGLRFVAIRLAKKG